jgi:hypothetical protein
MVAFVSSKPMKCPELVHLHNIPPGILDEILIHRCISFCLVEPRYIQQSALRLVDKLSIRVENLQQRLVTTSAALKFKL